MSAPALTETPVEAAIKDIRRDALIPSLEPEGVDLDDVRDNAPVIKSLAAALPRLGEDEIVRVLGVLFAHMALP